MGIHSIIVIKNNKEEYLQYFDEKWNSYLFLNCKLPNGNNYKTIKNKIATDLKLDKNKIEVELIGEKKHKKFSESAKKEKEYIHMFYKVNLNQKINEREFTEDKIKYKWFSYNELVTDERIKKVNGDIVGFIKEFNL